MPLIASSNSSASKRPVIRKTEKSTQPVSKPSTSETKLKVTEKLDLNINSKKALSGGIKRPNIDVLEIPKLKDNRRLSSRFKISKFREIEELSPLKEAAAHERENLLLEKIRQCCVVFDWNDATSDIKYKEIKKRSLIEISEYLCGVTGPLNDQITKELVCMLGINIFRTLPPSCTPMGPDPEGEDDEPYYEPSWPHLQHVYELFLRFLESSDFSPSVAKAHIDQTFIIYIMDLFDCEDDRERDYLKTVLHRIYGKMVSLRSFIRKQINNVFYRLIYETESFKGTGELLEILGSIINGFQVPLKEEHKEFLKRVLLPMHKVATFGSYQPQLAYCVVEFIKKDPTLLKVVVLQGLIRFWPKTQSLKEIMFLNELEECLELSNEEEFRLIAKPVFIQLAKCISSQQFQVCEKALLFWNEEALHPMIVKNIDIILPVTFPSLYQAKQHWNKAIHTLVFNSLKIMMDINQKLFDECTVKLKEEKLREFESNKKRQDWWNSVDCVAKKHPLYEKFGPGDDLLSLTISTKNSTAVNIQPTIKELTSENSNVRDSGSADSKKKGRSEPVTKPATSKITKTIKN